VSLFLSTFSPRKLFNPPNVFLKVAYGFVKQLCAINVFEISKQLYICNDFLTLAPQPNVQECNPVFFLHLSISIIKLRLRFVAHRGFHKVSINVVQFRNNI
jgi:hypothetical protein